METIPSADYRSERQKRGSQKGVALSLGVDWRTIQRREAGDVPITREAWLALCALPLRKTKKAPTRKGQNDQGEP
jgi:hypothetical protein